MISNAIFTSRAVTFCVAELVCRS